MLRLRIGFCLQILPSPATKRPPLACTDYTHLGNDGYRSGLTEFRKGSIGEYKHSLQASIISSSAIRIVEHAPKGNSMNWLHKASFEEATDCVMRPWNAKPWKALSQFDEDGTVAAQTKLPSESLMHPRFPIWHFDCSGLTFIGAVHSCYPL
ncbi:hypothetical protein IscW_ISCW024189 [Ixodes scapularis]|uniref:Uncharacterized protein n=1 Tax=Ixodes scapularis TaxID=6945 RepID=B7PA54_IXOSC|nr:hypothetical protein IscW_ISCW024189 [Ixodes scapularis]|eukprot:XP_002406243.1 hypothetical protein IscW_ISCW024189 [Ixodes scapularis]